METPDLSLEALLIRKALAEKATPGPWKKSHLCEGDIVRAERYTIIASVTEYENDGSIGYVFNNAINNRNHIAANSPDVVIATINELIRLRNENERLEQFGDRMVTIICKICNVHKNDSFVEGFGKIVRKYFG